MESMSNPGINRCPAEVLIAFIEASEHDDRRTLRGVNKVWRTLATPLAFDSLMLEHTKEGVARMIKLFRARLAKWAKRLEYRAGDQAPLAFGDTALIPPNQQDPVTKAVTAILSDLTRLFPLLESFHVRLFAGRHFEALHVPMTREEIIAGVSKYIMQQFNVFDALTEAGNSPPLRLKTLSLRNLLPCPEPAMMEEGFKTLMESVENLTLTVHRARTLDSQEYWEAFWQEYLPDYILAPAQSSLTSLSMTSDQPVGTEWPGVNFPSLHFPSLCSLKLGGFCFDIDSNLEDFILRHQTTLTSLVLDSCPMHTGATFRNKIPQRKWSQVFDRLEVGLTELTYVRVMCKYLWGLDVEASPRTEMALTYETSTSGYGYNRGEPVNSAVEREDRRALEKFYVTVDERRREEGLGPLESLAAARARPQDRLPRAEEFPELIDMVMAGLLTTHFG
ncbi:uncharacterized protein C8Q71DRAFT_272612 [Rhodofomes roseus]|uniref:F-box domain-containing protein n=1 Tax=Rhodofomes roseus TaxID=34475 RepID=A0ABQ8K5V2_9APHY|nr:uncharacterized protein C8Q71DRAFT_272612 [Rhodofomes roseus]KAH9832333.1 hypothetical protein C8Q71DRAFT_272612 [Rhodofomes roseus]